MPSRHVHHDRSRVWVYVRDADGQEVHRVHATRLVGSPLLYGMMLDGLEWRLRDGETIDESEATEAQRVLDDKRRECLEAVHRG